MRISAGEFALMSEECRINTGILKKSDFFRAIIPSFPIFAPLKRTIAYQKF